MPGRRAVAKISSNLFAIVGAASLGGCKPEAAPAQSAELTSAPLPTATTTAAAPATTTATSTEAAAPSVATTDAACAAHPCVGAIAREVSVWQTPARSKRIGYLRLGSRVRREASPAGKEGCAGGFYKIEPRGYVCVGEEATLDMNHALLRAAAIRPDVTKPLPYRYAFVRAVAPQYLRAPTKEEQLKSEFKLSENLAWWKKRSHEASPLVDGANDVSLPWRKADARKSSSLSFGERFGAQSAGEVARDDNDGFDPLPFWLEGGKRAIPNVSTFKVPTASVFADRVRRHTGLALVGAFKLGPEAFDREFAITTDLRMVPLSKLKPDSGSPWHGVELGGDLPAPMAFARGACDKKKGVPCTQTLRFAESGATRGDKELSFRQAIALTGKVRRHEGSLYRELTDGRWAKASELGAVVNPDEWPGAADRGEKWIEVSIENQTLVLWQGRTPTYATLVSTGQDGMDDPKTSKATPRGFFRIKAKHVTATMDSNERSASSGTGATAAPEEKEKTGRRRGEGLFELRDVPYIAYFEAGYALHSAYWHDVFGNARSHGCINLSPIDALRVFGFSDPPVPEGWHGVNAEDKEGTVVYIHR